MADKKLNVAVIFGGRSGEHAVSLVSAKFVLSMLKPEKYNITQIGISKQGAWWVGVDVLQALVDQGNTVAMIEHNMEMIKEADYIIDLGPEGGEAGGRVVTTGSPAELLVGPNGSHTTRYLKK